jgi:hypothetical protein
MLAFVLVPLIGAVAVVVVAAMPPITLLAVEAAVLATTP